MHCTERNRRIEGVNSFWTRKKIVQRMILITTIMDKGSLQQSALARGNAKCHQTIAQGPVVGARQHNTNTISPRHCHHMERGLRRIHSDSAIIITVAVIIE